MLVPYLFVGTNPVFIHCTKDFDETWCLRIQAERFRWHNFQWIEMVEPVASRRVLTSRDATEEHNAAFGTGQARARHRQTVIGTIGSDDDEDEEDDENGYNLGFASGIDDAADFLLSLSQGVRNASAKGEGLLRNEFGELDYEKMEKFYTGNVFSIENTIFS